MNRFIRPLLFWTLILCACSTSLPPTDTAPPVLPTSIATEAPASTITITASSYGGCGYQWAYRDLPDLSSKFLQAIQQLQPSAQANAFAFGEDCVYADGHADFIPMETDFNITLQINDLADPNECGEWITKVMQIILDIPKEEIIGPRPGRVSMSFQSGSEQKNFNFYIDRYQALSTDLSNTEICTALQTQP
jgi:hypothetical protein